MKKYILIPVFFCISAISFTQAGRNVYEFLNLTPSGLVTSIGGANVSIHGNDPNMAYHNPALLLNGMDRSVSLNYVNYFAGINYGLAMYSRSFEAGNFAAGITYLNYGSFTEADNTGTITGTFRAAEYAFSFIYSRQIDTSFSIGLNLKPVLSHLERYSSFGIAIDLGIGWQNRKKTLSAGIALRNTGAQITTYRGEPGQRLPFRIQAGITHRLEYAPLRLSLTLNDLHRIDLNGNTTSEAGGDTQNNVKINNLLKHIVPGIELIPHRNFYLSAGYNPKRRIELQTTSGDGATGFTWGFGVNTSWIDLEFGRAIFHSAGASTSFSLIIRRPKSW